MFTWLKQLFSRSPSEHFTGVLNDVRSLLDKDKDYLAEEILAMGQVNWREKTPTEWRRFPQRFQDGSFSCVAQSVAKSLGIDNQNETGKFAELSARDIYTRRVNKPAPGMVAYDAFAIASDHGTTTETLLPSQNISEERINQPVVRTDKMVETAKIYRSNGYVKFDDPTDIDRLATAVEMGKGIVIFLRFIFGEIFYGDVAEVRNSQIIGAHAVTVVDYTLWQGQKALVIEDSAGLFNSWPGQRLVTESFLKQRCYFAGYPINLTNPPEKSTPVPRHRFNTHLFFADEGPDVVALQDILRYEGLFPAEVPSTGKYYQITAKGVLAFQKKHQVANVGILDVLAGRSCGPKTIAKLNELYGT